MKKVYLQSPIYTYSFKDYLFEKFGVTCIFIDSPEDADVIVIEESLLHIAFFYRKNYPEKPIYIIRIDRNSLIFMRECPQMDRKEAIIIVSKQKYIIKKVSEDSFLIKPNQIHFYSSETLISEVNHSSKADIERWLKDDSFIIDFKYYPEEMENVK